MPDSIPQQRIPARRMSPEDAIRIARETAQQLIAAYPDLANDPDALIGTLDGECDALDVAARLIERALAEEDRASQCEYLIAQRAQSMSDLRSRKERFLAPAKKLRSAARQIIDACRPPGDAPGPTLRRPGFSAWVNKANPAQRKLIEGDASKTPASLMKPQPAIPDHDAIRARLLAGEEVPGWALGEAEPTLTVRQS